MSTLKETKEIDDDDDDTGITIKVNHACTMRTASENEPEYE
jgi:hypothetical protein